MSPDRWLTQNMFVGASACDLLITAFDRNVDACAPHSHPFWDGRVISAARLVSADSAEARAVLGDIASRASALARDRFGLDVRLQVSQLVRWPAGTSQPSHRDEYFPDTILAAIVYLNEDFVGGETELEDLAVTIAPRRGTIALFDGARVRHRVHTVRSGIRYTNALWFGPATGAR